MPLSERPDGLDRLLGEGDLVVITHPTWSTGQIGTLRITPGWATVGVTANGWTARVDPEHVRKLRNDDRVVNV